MGETINVFCPQCGQVYSMLPAQSGQTVQCARCRQIFTAGAHGGGAPGNPAPQAFAPPGERVGNGMAIASLVCGLMFCLPIVSSIFALVFGIIGLSKTRDPRVSGKAPAIAGIILGILGLIVAPSIMLPSLNRAREMADRVKCQQQMTIIGQGIQRYEAQNRGKFPPSLSVLVNSGMINTRDLVCPSDARGGGQVSYVLARQPFLPGTGRVWLYEPTSDHQNQGANFLFDDGHVEFILNPRADAMIAQLQSGVNPPR